MSKPQVVVYGASGYTGKQIAGKLAGRRIPFIAAGRDAERLKAQMALVPELAGAEYEVRGVEHDEAALTRLFDGCTVVFNVVGPFMQLGDPVVRACLAAGCHYLDSTGETDWMRHLRDEYGQAFAGRGLLLAPACSYMWTGGAMAAELALEQPGIDSLDIVYLADSNTSVASTKSFFRMLVNPQYSLQNNQMVQWKPATPFTVTLPGVAGVRPALPWGGGGEPVWYENDSRVRNCQVLVAFNRPEMMAMVLDRLIQFEKDAASLSRAEREAYTNRLGGDMVSEEPARESLDDNRSIVVCHGRGRVTGRTVVLYTAAPYAQTAVFAAYGVQALLTGRSKAAGFAAATTAFGARALLGALAEDGLAPWEPVVL